MENKHQKAVAKDFLNRVLEILADIPDPKVNKYMVTDMGTLQQEVLDIQIGPKPTDSLHIMIHSSKAAI